MLSSKQKVQMYGVHVKLEQDPKLQEMLDDLSREWECSYAEVVDRVLEAFSEDEPDS